MIETRIIRYRTTPECADENARLIEGVFAELAEGGVPDIRYEAFRLDDSVSFVHVFTLDSDNNPLQNSPAFAAFQSGLGARLEGELYPAVATLVGSHGVG